ncbi:MAG: rhomboid family intramembrane serine protease [Dehalococcoidia bacterium]
MSYRAYRVSNSNIILYIVAINFVVFVATLVNQDLTYHLGLIPAEFLERPWTIVTSMFVHAGLWHIIANMLTLYFLGSYLLRIAGPTALLVIYFLGGIAGSLLFVLLGPPSTIVVGASGAIFAVGGTLAMMRPQARVIVFPIPAPIPLWIAIIGGFVVLSFLPGVAWQAHLGGLILGLIAGYLLNRRAGRYRW